ncbi:MAG: hypothetical protein KF819_38025 [Labilithrix sp.]|nr:hypothetical protein [Labilithrix sp.]
MGKSAWWAVVAMFVGLTSGACVEREAVEPVFARATAALTSASVKWINGTYTSCLDRSGSWSVRVAGSDPLDHPPLSVVRNDAACRLAITEIVGDQTYVATPVLPLGSTYEAQPSSFALSGESTAFYANAKLDDASFASDFQITVVQSDEPDVVDVGDVLATYVTVTGSAVALAVLPPNYVISFAGATPLTIQMDATKTVQSVTGSISLTDGTRTGQQYVVDATLGASPSYAQVEVAFTAGIVGGRSYLISGASPSIPASRLELTGSLATAVVRTIIVSRTVGGVLGFQLFRISFKAP